jgi:uncharacterized RDD family membrane protein YckC
MQAQHNQADVSKQIIAGLIDAAIILLLFWQYSKYLAPRSIYDLPVYPIHPVYLIVGGLILYRFFFLVLFNGTPGMKMLKVVFLNGEEASLSLSEKLLAAVFILYRGVEYYEKPSKAS